MEPAIFVKPERFNPDRWMQEKQLDRYLANFGKGSRMCLGIKYYESAYSYITAWRHILTLLTD